MSFFFHSHAQTKSCPKQTFSLERNHSWDFLQHSGNNVKSSLLQIRRQQNCFSRLLQYHSSSQMHCWQRALKDTKAKNSLNDGNNAEKKIMIFPSDFSLY